MFKFYYKKKYVFYICYLVLIFLIIEILTRIFFPEFNYKINTYSINKNHKVIKNINIYTKTIEEIGELHIRVKNIEDINQLINLKLKQKKIIITGDSVTEGYGVEFDEIYYNKINKNDYRVLALSHFGLSFFDIFENIEKNLIKVLHPGDKLIYQFNFNDITPVNRVKDNKKNNLHEGSRNFLRHFAKSIELLKYKYLLNSTFLKLLNYHASRYVKKIYQSCEKRGILALDQYSYSYFSKSFLDQSNLLWQEFEKKLIETNTFLNKKGIEFIILISPISIQLDNQGIVNSVFNIDLSCSGKNGRTFLLELLKKNKIRFIDPLINMRKFAKEYKDVILFHEFDTNHPNKIGHKLIAEELNKNID